MSFYFLSLFKYVLTSDVRLDTSKHVLETSDNDIMDKPPVPNISEDTDTVMYSLDSRQLLDLDDSSSTISSLSSWSYHDNECPPMEIQDEICAKDKDSSKDENMEQSHSNTHNCLYYVSKEKSKDRTVDHKSSNVLVDEIYSHEENIWENIEKSRTLCSEGDKNFIYKVFNIYEDLGKGSFSTVNRVTTIDLNISCAMKRTNLRISRSSVFSEAKTCEVLKNVNHKNIVKVYGLITHNDLVYIFMENLSAQLLWRYIECNFKIMTERCRRGMMLQLLDGIECLLMNDIVHGDLSATNILVDEKGVIKIIDFGFSHILYKGCEARTPLTADWYLAPGRIDKVYTRSDDLWSFAMIMYFIYHGEVPFTEEEVYCMDCDVQPILRFDESIPADAKDLMEKMSLLYLEDRLGGNDLDDIEVIRKHPYFENMKNL